MEQFAGKTAVITGAASGIGEGLARYAAAQGMNLVLADVNIDKLEAMRQELSGEHCKVVTQKTDVSDLAALQSLADLSYDTFGQVDLLFNNAGVLISGYSWECEPKDWQWILNINLMGVINGLNVFVPRMIAAGREAHIVNTSSLAGFLSAPLMGPYTVSKQAVRALTETLHYDLRAIQSPVHCSVLCPGPVATEISHSGGGHQKASEVDGGAGQKQLMDFLSSGISQGMSPAECARIVFDGIREQRFWIFTHEDFKPEYQRRVQEAIENCNPVYEVYVTEEQ